MSKSILELIFFALFLLFSFFLQLDRKKLAYINIFWLECEILGSKKSKNGGSETPKIPHFIPNYTFMGISNSANYS